QRCCAPCAKPLTAVQPRHPNDSARLRRPRRRSIRKKERAAPALAIFAAVKSLPEGAFRNPSWPLAISFTFVPPTSIINIFMRVGGIALGFDIGMATSDRNIERCAFKPQEYDWRDDEDVDDAGDHATPVTGV